MQPDIFAVCRDSAAVKALLGQNPVRFWPRGKAPKDPALPYAVFQVIFGSPENTLGDKPDVDASTIQVDVYAHDSKELQNVVTVLRDAIEPVAYISRWGGEDEDPATHHPHYQFDVDWYQQR